MNIKKDEAALWRRVGARFWSGAGGVMLVAALAISGCQSAAVVTRAGPAAATQAGIPYFLPKGRLKVDVKAGYLKKGKSVELAFLDPTIAGAETAADSSREYTLEYRPSAFADDRLCVARGANGLLTSISLIATDRTSDVAVRLVELASLVATAGGSSPLLPVGKLSEGEQAATIVWDKDPFISVAFDPDDPTEVEDMQAAIRSGLRSHLQQLDAVNRANGVATAVSDKLKPLLENDAPLVDVAGGRAVPVAGEPARASDGSIRGVYFRSTVNRQFTLAPKVGGVTRSAAVQWPDAASTRTLDIERTFAVAKTYKVALQNGVLTKFEVEKPSEALAAATLPLDMAGAVIEVPARFFTAIGRSLKSETSALAAQAELLKAEIELEKVRRAEAGSVPAGAAASAATTTFASTRTAPGALTPAATCQ